MRYDRQRRQKHNADETVWIISASCGEKLVLLREMDDEKPIAQIEDNRACLLTNVQNWNKHH